MNVGDLFVAKRRIFTFRRSPNGVSGVLGIVRVERGEHLLVYDTSDKNFIWMLTPHGPVFIGTKQSEWTDGSFEKA